MTDKYNAAGLETCLFCGFRGMGFPIAGKCHDCFLRTEEEHIVNEYFEDKYKD